MAPRAPRVATARIPRWTPNPYALVEQLLGTALDPDWTVAQRQVIEGLRVKSADELFFGVEGDPPALALLFEVARAVTSPRPLVELRALDEVRRAKQRFGEAAVERALLFLVPVAQSVFAPIGAKPPPGHRYAGIYVTLPDYLRAGASFIDATQGAAADCYLIAAMNALAWVYPQAWPRAVAACGGARGMACRFSFFHGVRERRPPIEVRPGVAATLPPPGDAAAKVGLDTGPRLYYAHSSDRREGWPGILEKAYLMQFGKVSGPDPTPADYLALDESSFPHVACQRLAGGTRRAVACGGALEGRPEASQVVHRLCEPRRGVTRVPTMAWTWETHVPAMGNATWRATGLIANHAYVVLGIVERGGRPYVVLRNPHGFSAMRAGPDAYLQGSWRPGPGATGVREVVLNTAGVFALPAAWFDRAFGTVAFVTPPSRPRRAGRATRA